MTLICLFFYLYETKDFLLYELKYSNQFEICVMVGFISESTL
ncbi:hypothetical protein AQPE_0621 [Aquipluma nitroreducens]|uniref:Uncharacterized protein n=1 Tax=Aquipluma nitroreducens TaxID=2010828 RepID=A0A5K7S4L4_9BACT|nr:hypothetical protein AQPE_0621 [Aquipluma nitroreducens]